MNNTMGKLYAGHRLKTPKPIMGACMGLPSVRNCSILGMRVDEVNYDLIVTQVRQWVHESDSRYFCSSTVHMVMESHDDLTFKAVVNGADLVGTDGAPIVWVSRWLGLDKQTCVFAWEVTTRLCEMAAQEQIPVGFYGSTPEVVQELVKNLKKRFPTLKVPYAFSPPFRPLTAEEDKEIVDNIKRSGVRILFVGLGCPKQERWMNEHRGRVPATMLGVGWAFEVLAGRSKAAPAWIQNIGMQWLYRVVLNPRKLWWRYLKTNPRFVVLVLRQLWATKVRRKLNPT